MALTLDQYAAFLEARKDILFPAPPDPVAPKAKPHVKKIEGLKAVFWNVYGTLVTIAEGDLKFETDSAFMMNVAIDKTIHEFKMWASMARKPGQPADYMREIYTRELNAARMLPSKNEKHPELQTELVWEGVVKRLTQKEYKWDVGMYGSLNEYSKKIAFFFHASLQGFGAFKGAAEALNRVNAMGVAQGFFADGQCFTPAHVGWAFRRKDEFCDLDICVPAPYRVLSYERKGRKPSENFQAHLAEVLERRGLEPFEALHVGSSMDRDILPAKALGLRTALFTGDKASLSFSKEQLKDESTRPDLLLTELVQIEHVIG